jgi:hypothetical protein
LICDGSNNGGIDSISRWTIPILEHRKTILHLIMNRSTSSATDI